MDGNVLNRGKEEKLGARIRTLKQGEETAHLDMLNLCFDQWGRKEEWKRKYELYPNFSAAENVIIVQKDGEWAGGGTAWFRHALTKDCKKTRVYCAADLYVHPDHRGRGVYSTAMRSLNRLAQKKGAVLGFAFPSIYRLPAIALPKYGFVGVFHPMTHVFVLNPEKFFRFLISRAKTAYLPEKFNGAKFELAVSFDTPSGKRVITDTFQVEKGQISEYRGAPDKKHLDLTVKTEIGVLLKIVSGFYLGKRAFIRSLLSAFVRGRLRFRFSTRFIRLFLGL
ncbi:MAG: GNAT family N-acetyltransferase [Candidatus Bathyarchaeota archaeon]|nr:MAG: GNAT family N-acetyltransferase [Candidatus Bathyarchaeota archaeon]